MKKGIETKWRRRKKNKKKRKKCGNERKKEKKRDGFHSYKKWQRGDTRIEYKRDVKHNSISKTFSKIKKFLKESQKMMRRFKIEGFYRFKKLKKQKNGDAKSDQKSSKKRRNQKHLYLDGRENGTRKDMCSKKKKKRQQTEKGKRKREMKNRSFFLTKKSKAKTNQRRETRREKVKEEKRFVRREKKEVVQKGSEKTFFFSKKINAKRKSGNIICPKRGDFCPTKRVLAWDKDWKTFLGFFFGKGKKEQHVSIFFLFFCERRSKKKLKKKEMKIDWRRARDKKNKLCQDFFEADKMSNNKKGFKNPSFKNKHGNIILKKTFKKKKLAKKIFVRQDNREEIFPCFWKRVLDSEKTQQENKREKMKDTRKTQKTPKKKKQKEKSIWNL